MCIFLNQGAFVLGLPCIHKYTFVYQSICPSVVNVSISANVYKGMGYLVLTCLSDRENVCVCGESVCKSSGQ